MRDIVPLLQTATPKAGAPTVSVVVPCYNGARYLARALESALSQDYPIHQLIAVDDGSTDGTSRVLSQFGEKVTVLPSPDGANTGPSAARNRGIERSDGELIAFLDGDDVWYQGKIRRQVEKLLDRPDVGLVYTQCFAIDENDAVLWEYAKVDPRGFPALAERLLMDCFIPTPSAVMVRRALLERLGGFDTTLYACGDHDLWIRVAEIAEFDSVDEPLVGYRKYRDQQSVTSAARMWSQGFEVVDKACQRREQYRRLRKRRYAVLHYHLGVCEWQNHNPLGAAWRFVAAGLLDPFRVIHVAREAHSARLERNLREKRE